MKNIQSQKLRKGRRHFDFVLINDSLLWPIAVIRADCQPGYCKFLNLTVKLTAMTRKQQLQRYWLYQATTIRL